MSKKKKKDGVDPSILKALLFEDAAIQSSSHAYVPLEPISYGENSTFFDKVGVEPSPDSPVPVQPDLNRMVTKKELAEFLRVSPGYVDSLKRRGQIPYIQEQGESTQGGQRIPIRYNLKEVCDALRQGPDYKKLVPRFSPRRKRGEGSKPTPWIH
jgi:hypothetical protein